jgi:hypothetical protein
MLQPVASWGDRSPHGGIRCEGDLPVKRASLRAGRRSHDSRKARNVRKGRKADTRCNYRASSRAMVSRAFSAAEEFRLLE